MHHVYQSQILRMAVSLQKSVLPVSMPHVVPVRQKIGRNSMPIEEIAQLCATYSTKRRQVDIEGKLLFGKLG
jgi:hypothetical protein